jgi:alpha-1,6-mannosyltransferase
MLFCRTDEIETTLNYRKIVSIGIASGILYLLINQIKGDIYLNGLSSNNSDIVSLHGVTANYLNLTWQLIAYYSIIIALFALYFYLLRSCYYGQLRSRRLVNLTLFFPVIFNLVLIFVRPYFSIDIFTYMANGYFGITPGGNPYINASKEAANTSFGHQLLSWGWQPVHGISPYGPLWTHFSMAVLRITQNVAIDVLLIKSLVVTASLLSAVLIWQILGKVRPQVQLLGTIVYLWNPMAIVEFAAEGHNDAVMIVFTLFALLLTIDARPVTSMLTLVFSILVKYVSIIFLPAQLVYYWRTYRATGKMSRIWVQILLGLILGLGVAILLYWQMWIGLDTFQGLIQQANSSSMPSMTLILSQLIKLLPLGLPGDILASLIIKVIFGITLFLATWKVDGNKSLLKSCASIALVYTLIVPTAYWPWYVSLPLALMALSPSINFQIITFVLTFCSSLIAPLALINNNGLIPYRVFVLITSLFLLLQSIVIITTIFQYHSDRKIS